MKRYTLNQAGKDDTDIEWCKAEDVEALTKERDEWRLAAATEADERRKAHTERAALKSRVAELEAEKKDLDWAISGESGCATDGSNHLAMVKALRLNLQAKLDELLSWPCEGVDCDVDLADLHLRNRHGGTWFCVTCWNEALGKMHAQADARMRELQEAQAKLDALLKADTLSGLLEARAAAKEGR